MVDIFWIIGAIFLGLHGLVHLMGFFAYWPLMVIPDLAYKTTILGGQMDLGGVGMRAFSILWLIPSLGFLAIASAMIRRWPRWQPVLLAITLISFLVTALDWTVAFRGILVDVAILVGFLIASRRTRLIPVQGD
ncbi:MAG: ABC transporter permease [Anaerolineae bacterium]|nr:ABC transporter permease [Anaerolineae bacterium]